MGVIGVMEMWLWMTGRGGRGQGVRMTPTGGWFQTNEEASLSRMDQV